MRIEFSYWPGNTEVKLFETLGDCEVEKDSFYTSARETNLTAYLSDEQAKVEDLFYVLEDLLPPPKIGGEWSEFHPYWAERAERRKRREARGLQAPAVDSNR